MADIRDALERDEPELARSFRRLTPRVGWRVWAAVAAGLLVSAAGIWCLGLRAVGLITVLLALGAPFVVSLAIPNTDGPTEHPLHAGRPSGDGEGSRLRHPAAHSRFLPDERDHLG